MNQGEQIAFNLGSGAGVLKETGNSGKPREVCDDVIFGPQEIGLFGLFKRETVLVNCTSFADMSG